MATFNMGHKWLLKITEIENKLWEKKKKKKADRLHEKWEKKKDGILLSSEKYLLRKNMSKLNLAKGCPMSQHTCPHCSKKFRHKGSLNKHMETIMCSTLPYGC